MKWTSLFVLPGLYYPVLKSSDLIGSTPRRVLLFNEPLVVYRNSSNHIISHTDVCPHLGASLSRGWVDSDGCITCPYHGFSFHEGAFVGGMGPRKRNTTTTTSKIMPVWEVKEETDLIYLRAPTSAPYYPIYRAPESNDTSFRCISGSRRIPQCQGAVTENIIDPTHISVVHTFGNPTSLPIHFRFHRMDPFSGKSTFTYRPRAWTLSSWLTGGGPRPNVTVENEFYLPSTTVTRVRVDSTAIKTVVTRSLPVDEGTTILFWEVYRNFWLDEIGLGDVLVRYMMDRTLNEDVGVLRHVYRQHRDGILRTPFDSTIMEYRKSVQSWMSTLGRSAQTGGDSGRGFGRVDSF